MALSGPRFPPFDLAAFESATGSQRHSPGREIDDTCRSTGCLAVSDHGAPRGVIDGVWSKATGFSICLSRRRR